MRPAEGTGELFAADPPRVLRVSGIRAQDACWWGIDPSTLRASVGIVRPVDGAVERRVVTHSFAQGPARLSLINSDIRDLVAMLAASYPPGFVLVEQPFAKQVEPQLYYAIGALLVGLYDGLHRALDVVPKIEVVGPSTWKARALGQGHGHAKKPEVMEWAQANGYEGALQDEADAFAIAEAARRTVAFA